MMHKRTLLIVTSALALHACTTATSIDIKRLQSQNNESFINQSSSINTGSSVKWWEDYQDASLNTGIEKLLSQNLSLKEAGERVIQAKEGVRQSRAAFFPTLSGDISGGRSFQNNNFNQGLPFNTDRTYNSSYNAQLQSSWEIDLFGRIRGSVTAAQETFKAAQFDQQALTQSLIAEFINARVDVSANKELENLAQEITKNRQETYDLIKRRYDLGTGTIKLANVYRAEEQFLSAQATQKQYERLLAASLYRLDILLGQRPGTSDISTISSSLKTPPLTVPVCLPAALLDNRPDLRAAEARIEAANANIDIALANLYPQLNLTGALGFNSNEASNLFSAEQLAGSILASLTAPIFQGGALRSNVRVKESEAKALAYNYANQILNAIGDVENALKAENTLGAEIKEIEKSVYALKRAEELTYNRYLNGIEILSNVLDIRQNLYLSQQKLIQKQQEKWNARTALHLALGGNWLDTNTANNLCAPETDKITLSKEDIKNEQ